MGVELAVCQNSILLFVYIIESYLKMTKFLIILINIPNIVKGSYCWRLRFTYNGNKEECDL